ncbi:MAG: zinc ribbon domain-containing protein [Prevotella sp.]|nr:zinc ribbon domain-containing protein [Prevotella sp.]
MNGTKDLAKVKRCPNGHAVSDDMKYCPVCGVEISITGIRFCPNCGKERHVTDKFCSNCGFPFEQQIVEKEEEKNDDFSFFGFLWIDN